MSRGAIHRWLAGAGVLALMGVVLLHPLPTRAQQDEIIRKVKSKVAPVYPAIAKKAHIQGAVILEAEINERGIIDNLRAVSNNMREFTETIKTRPYTLIRSSSPKPHATGQAPK